MIIPLIPYSIMYIIVNKTQNANISLKGGWPERYVTALLEQGDDFIVISLYSNTIKIPCGYEEYNSIKEYKWKEYDLPFADLANGYLEQIINNNAH
jgi:hypothetical protein